MNLFKDHFTRFYDKFCDFSRRTDHSNLRASVNHLRQFERDSYREIRSDLPASGTTAAVASWSSFVGQGAILHQLRERTLLESGLWTQGYPWTRSALWTKPQESRAVVQSQNIPFTEWWKRTDSSPVSCGGLDLRVLRYQTINESYICAQFVIETNQLHRTLSSVSFKDWIHVRFLFQHSGCTSPLTQTILSVYH